MAVKEYFDWIEESVPDFTSNAQPGFVPESKDYWDCYGIVIPHDAPQEEIDEGFIEAGRRLLTEGDYEDMMVDGRPITNLEMHAILWYSKWSQDANAAEWWQQLIEWIGGIDGHTNCEA